MNAELNAAIWGAITGALMSMLITLALPFLRRCIMTWRISILTDQPHDGFARFRVVNCGFWTINDAMLYLALEFKKEDVIPASFFPRCRSHIEPDRFVPLNGDQICWNVRSPNPNPMKVMILAKER